MICIYSYQPDYQEGKMARKKGKSVSFDAMVKFFMQTYGIPTKKDVEKLIERLDRLEVLIKSGTGAPARRKSAAKTKAAGKATRKTGGMTASDTVLDVVAKAKDGIGFSDIQAKTGYAEKKLRNIIFRLNKLKKIQRKDRGVYSAA